MSNGDTPERPEPGSGYTLEARWKHIRSHIQRKVAAGELVKPGYLAGTYGGKLISKADVSEEVRKQTELGGSAK